MGLDRQRQSLTVANCFIVVDDLDDALTFYRDVLGLIVRQDAKGDGFRWLTLSTEGQPELEITFSAPDYPGTSEADKGAMSDLLAKGLLPGLIFTCDDVDALFKRVSAHGADVLQEPTDQFYGVRDCAFRDPAGNMVRFKQAHSESTD